MAQIVLQSNILLWINLLNTIIVQMYSFIGNGFTVLRISYLDLIGNVTFLWTPL